MSSLFLLVIAASLHAQIVCADVAASPDWKIGEWSTCKELCSTITRTVDCWDFATNNRSNSSCPQPRPASQAQCPCEDAFAPIATSLVSAGCPAEWSEAECECCPNGVVDSAGECCSSANTVAMVDMKGKCCAAGYIDACGVCGGDGVYLDRQGTCCKGADKVDGNGLCCEDKVDACGVCGGSNTTCGTIVEVFAIVNMTSGAIATARGTIEEMISETLHFPSILLTVTDIDQLEVPSKSTLAGADGQEVDQSATAAVDSPVPLEMNHTDIVGAQDSDTMMAALTVVVEMLPLNTLEERAAMCAQVWGRCHGDEPSEHRSCCSSELRCVVKNERYGQCLRLDDEIPKDWEGSIVEYSSSNSLLPARRLADAVAPAPVADEKNLESTDSPVIDLTRIVYALSQVAMPRDDIIFFTVAATRMCGDSVCSPHEMQCGIPASVPMQDGGSTNTTMHNVDMLPLTFADIPFGAHGFPRVCMKPMFPDKMNGDDLMIDPAHGASMIWHHDDNEAMRKLREVSEITKDNATEVTDEKLYMEGSFDSNDGNEGDEGDEGTEGDEGQEGDEGDEGDEGESDDGTEGDEGQEGDEGNEGDEGDEGHEGDEGDEGSAVGPNSSVNPTFLPSAMHSHDGIPETCDLDCKPHFGCPVVEPTSRVLFSGQPYLMCAGNGICNFDTAECKCHPGYNGTACAVCAEGFQRSSYGTCQPPLKFDTCPKPATDFGVKYMPWSDCSATCGGGNQTREWGCYDGSGIYKTEESNCVNTPQPEDLRQTCNQIPCESFTLKEGTYGACSKACGGGFQTTQHICLSSFGYAAPISKCQNVPDSWRQCNNQACENAYWTYTAFSACSATCGGGNKTREATCNTPAGVATIDAECTSVGIEPLEVSTDCNTKPCAAYNWDVTAWGECDAACGGMRTRTATCVNVDTKVPVATELVNTTCTGQRPTVEQDCEPCGFCEDVRLNENCSEQGTCENGACNCQEQWSGAICDVEASCESGVKDLSNVCCTTGVLNKNGQCCNKQQTGDSTPSTDASGECCAAGYSDKCGQCGGLGLGFDISGQCCEAPGVFDTQMYCCASGNVDACGVCDGAGDQCGTECSLQIATPARRRELLQFVDASDALKDMFGAALGYASSDFNMTTQVDSADPTKTDVCYAISTCTCALPSRKPMYRTSMQAILAFPAAIATTASQGAAAAPADVTVRLLTAQSSGDLPAMSGIEVAKTFSCGDNLCSPGEPKVAGVPDTDQTCIADCPLVLGVCPSPGGAALGDPTLECGGNGVCQPATLTCDCNTGYAGEACGWCASSTHRAVDGSCAVKLSSILSPIEDTNSTTPVVVPNPAPEPVPPPPLPPPPVASPPNDTDRNIYFGGRSTVPSSDSNRGGMIVGLVFLAVVVAAGAVHAAWAFKTGRFGGGSNQQYIIEDGPAAQGGEQDCRDAEHVAPETLPVSIQEGAERIEQDVIDVENGAPGTLPECMQSAEGAEEEEFFEMELGTGTLPRIFE